AAAVVDGREAGAASLRGAVDAFLDEQLAPGEWLQWGHHAFGAATVAWDADGWEKVSARFVAVARASGALAPPSLALNGRGVFDACRGDFQAAAAMVAEERAVNDAIGNQWFSYAGLMFDALGRQTADALSLTSSSYKELTKRGEGFGGQMALWTRAILC